jgi:hypothetical protein
MSSMLTAIILTEEHLYSIHLPGIHTYVYKYCSMRSLYTLLRSSHAADVMKREVTRAAVNVL